MSGSIQNTFLFSIDLEDQYLMLSGKVPYEDRITEPVEKYLDFLNRHKSKCTFFVVGDVARKHSELVKRINDEGHEIACHSDSHLSLDKHSQDTFSIDIEKNLDSLAAIGINNIKGFRAPILSITKQTQWAYSVLSKFGFEYSSSVLPATNPLFGWPSFGKEIRMIDGILEIPITTSKFLIWDLPVAAGTYFRLIPFRNSLKNIRRSFEKKHYVSSYFHPYDIDAGQKRIIIPGLEESMLLNRLMYLNRSKVLNRLESLMQLDCSINTYANFIRSYQKAEDKT